MKKRVGFIVSSQHETDIEEGGGWGGRGEEAEVGKGEEGVRGEGGKEEEEDEEEKLLQELKPVWRKTVTFIIFNMCF